MKVELYTQSGKPVDMEVALKYEEEFKATYDELYKQYEAKEFSIEDFKHKLADVDKKLADKYPMHATIDMPNSGKKWKELQMSYECPIMVAVSAETNKVILILMDSGY